MHLIYAMNIFKIEGMALIISTFIWNVTNNELGDAIYSQYMIKGNFVLSQ